MGVVVMMPLLLLVLSAGTDSHRTLLSQDDRRFLEGMASDVLEASRVRPGEKVGSIGPNVTGGTLIRPGGRGCYPAFWIRDYAMSLECGMVSMEEQRHMLLLTARHQQDEEWTLKSGSIVTAGSIPDHISFGNLPIFYPGSLDDYEGQGGERWGKLPSLDDAFFFIDMAYRYVDEAESREILEENVDGKRLYQRLTEAYAMPPHQEETGLVYATEDRRGVTFGFVDTVTHTGDLFFCSLLKFRAARQLADLAADRDEARSWQAEADRLRDAIKRTFVTETGFLKASTDLSAQADVWGTAFAVYVGALDATDRTRACKALAHAYEEGHIAWRGQIRHVPTTGDFSDSTAWERALTKKNTYQNGAYWGTATGWVVYAIAQEDWDLASRLAKEFVQDLREIDFRKGPDFGGPWECMHPENNHRQNPVYLTTVTCPLAAFNRLEKARTTPADNLVKLRVKEDGKPSGIDVIVGGQTLLHSPEEGLWSVATGWDGTWPEDWHHGLVTSVERTGPWTVLHGAIETPDGEWICRDAYRQEGRLIQGVRRYEWRGNAAVEHVTLSLRFMTPGTGNGIVMPGILYHGNPSGAKSKRTPVYAGRAGEEALFEEHRFPMPFVSLEWQGEDALLGAALHVVPSMAAYGNLPDQWWSLGAIARENGTELASLTGPCASNGQRGVIKAIQPGFFPYPNAYLNVPPGVIIEKTFYLEAYDVTERGSGFRRPVHTALSLAEPFSCDGLPSFTEILEGKYRFSKTRWLQRDDAAGFRKYPDKDIFVMGWCGQAASLGYALPVLSEVLGKEEDASCLDRAQRSLDFLSGAAFYDGGFHTWYDVEKGTWSHHEPLSQGQAMMNFARAIPVGKARGMKTERWEQFLKKACAFHADRILKEDWNPRSTDEAFFIAPLCTGANLFDVPLFLKAAEKAGQVYAARSVDMTEPYWGGTLDAQCEDKEGAFAALQGFLALYEASGEERYLSWARHACDVVLTYVVLWDIDMPPGRLRDHAFKTRGWTVVSAQNQHIDVFGVLIAPDVFRVGMITGDDRLKDIALLMYRSCGQLMDPYGSQGEQPQHTNYAQRGRVDAVAGLRGGYVEDWTVFWITAHFLNAAAQFKELGVTLEASCVGYPANLDGSHPIL